MTTYQWLAAQFMSVARPPSSTAADTIYPITVRCALQLLHTLKRARRPQLKAMVTIFLHLCQLHLSEPRQSRTGARIAKRLKRARYTVHLDNTPLQVREYGWYIWSPESVHAIQ